MKQILVLFSVFSFLFLSSFSNTKEEYNLTIEVENLRNSKGVLQVALYNKDGSIPDENYKNYFKIETAQIANGKSKITFKNLPKGKYAVNILHDENNNGKIGVTTFRWTQKLRLSALTLEDEKSKQPLQLGI
mgnify:CR=1 FL=1